ncbi:MAG: hypothetical protein IKM87_06305, partial [Clostridia bacterium]|nr:hypothetical protein [Clostridia bacterium]
KCIFKRTEEVAFRGGSSSERTAGVVHSLRGEFKLKDILAVIGFPKSTYMYWQKRFDREDPDAEILKKDTRYQSISWISKPCGISRMHDDFIEKSQ